ncbi:hypothetical protein JCM9534A_11960 [Catenuloplanes indicus JCM 9534]|uniref:DUF4832 domain-containing protein n=1 Tax=Catenuloplanes indicus TaxID=137267 RepID=A0AAE3VWY1_9ACTN|nr:hypothetical protein [Catenuloplanes indicus]
MPSDASGARIVAAFDDAFDVTKLEIRYPESAGGAADGRDIGYHDDSFCYREGSPAAGVTLPRSMGGSDYSQLQRALDRGVENKWTRSSMGGEVRPEIQGNAFDAWPGGAGQVDDMRACIELEHTTWKINQGSQGYAASDPEVAAAIRLMGYDLTATHAYLPDDAAGTATVGVTIENRGVAPFYYPWTVTLGLRNAAGDVVKTWDTPWDLRTVMPLKVRAFPVPGHPDPDGRERHRPRPPAAAGDGLLVRRPRHRHDRRGALRVDVFLASPDADRGRPAVGLPGEHPSADPDDRPRTSGRRGDEHRRRARPVRGRGRDHDRGDLHRRPLRRRSRRRQAGRGRARPGAGGRDPPR